jgi:HEAT repeat protein
MFPWGPQNIDKLKARRDIAGLLRALHDRHPDVRCAAAQALGEVAPEAAAAELVVALNDDSERVRQAAATALAQCGDPSLAERLAPALASPDEFVQHAAARALVQHFESETGAVLMERLRDPQPRVREAAAEALAQRMDAAATDVLISTLADRAWSVSEAAAGALLRIGPQAVARLCAALAYPDPALRRQAAYVLGQLAVQLGPGQRAQVAESLAGLLGDVQASVRASAVRALGRVREPAVLAPLATALADARPEVREAAAEALGASRDGRAVPALAAALGYEATVVRAAAARALAQLGPPAVVPAMAELLATNPDARSQAAAVLGELMVVLEDPSLRARAVEALRAGLRDPRECVRQAVARALAKWGPGTDVELIAAHAVVTQDWERLARSGSAAVEPLILLLNDGSAAPRRRADALARLASLARQSPTGRAPRARIIDVLACALADEEVSVRDGALAALVHIGAAVQDPAARERVVEHFARLLEGGTAQRRLAARALGQTGLAPAVEPLIAALSDPALEVRLAAGEALAQFYWQGHLDDQLRARILEQRAVLARRHADDAGAAEHVDNGGIGIAL